MQQACRKENGAACARARCCLRSASSVAVQAISLLATNVAVAAVTPCVVVGV